MLLTFRVRNARSFRDDVSIDFFSTRLGEPDVVRNVSWHEGGATVSVLPVLGIFGPNASGKTNLLRVMRDMREQVVRSFRSGDPKSGISRHSFQLDRASRQASTEFEISLSLDGVRYDYGFEIDDQEVISEWAARYPKGRKALLFLRVSGEIKFYGPLREYRSALNQILRSNALLLSTAGAAGTEPLIGLYRWFVDNLRLAEAANRGHRILSLVSHIESDVGKRQVVEFLRSADLGIVDIKQIAPEPALLDKVREALVILMDDLDLKDISDDMLLPPEFGAVELSHGGADGPVEMDFGDESQGTQVWMGLIMPVISSLATGSLLLVDELDASLHPTLVEQVIRLYQSPETNPRDAQLVFNMFDTRVMGDSSDDRVLGRDQIWFTDKLADGSSQLYSLNDFSPRKGESVERRHRRGHYGADPIVSPEDFAASAELVLSGGHGE